jgi:hypothetical protein
MSQYESLSDDFYLNMNLNTEMDLPQTRETVLHYFEQIQNIIRDAEFLRSGTRRIRAGRGQGTGQLPLDDDRTAANLLGASQPGYTGRSPETTRNRA